MATWTNPTTRVTGERITQAIWNVDLVENLKYLYDTLISSTSIVKTTVSAASPVASVDIQNIIQSGRDIKITGFLRPATDDVALFLRLNNRSGAADYDWIVSAGNSTGSDAADSEIELMNSGSVALVNVGNAANEYCWFNILIPGYRDVVASLPKPVLATVGWRNANGGASSACLVSGSLLSAEAINRVTLFFEAGNITEGVVSLEVTRP